MSDEPGWLSPSPRLSLAVSGVRSGSGSRRWIPTRPVAAIVVRALRPGRRPARILAWRPRHARFAAHLADGSEIGLVLADAMYLSLDNLQAEGPGWLIATGKRRTLEKAARRAAGEQEPRPGRIRRRPDRRNDRLARHRRRHHRLPPPWPHRRNPTATLSTTSASGSSPYAANPKQPPNGPSPPPSTTCSRPSPAATSDTARCGAAIPSGRTAWPRSRTPVRIPRGLAAAAREGTGPSTSGRSPARPRRGGCSG